MSAFDAFKSTVGVALMEGGGFLPQAQAPLQPLEGPRTWHLPRNTGDVAVTVASLAEAAASNWREALPVWRDDARRAGATSGVLVLTGVVPEDQPAPFDAEADDAGWQVWLVDLTRRSLRCPSVDPGHAEALPGDAAATIEAAIQASLSEASLSLGDLLEEERASLAGRPSFSAFLENQSAPACPILLGVILGLFVCSTALTLMLRHPAHLPLPTSPELLWLAVQHNSLQALLGLGATLRPLVEQGEFWRLLAANYLHAGILHVFVNAYSLAVLGPTLERMLGTPKFLAVWSVSGLLGASASVLFNPQAASVGASGALFGLLGAMLVLGLQFRGVVPRHQTRAFRDVALITLGVNMILGSTIPNIDNMAHLGGLLGGAASAYVLGPHPELTSRPGLALPAWSLWTLPLLAALAVFWGLLAGFSGRPLALGLG
ncbi:MAG: rhomboid family intramembrane serine protease [Candidatus Sericytochromatia bacterium]|nr:rhomboid family intramembrane serine protease [Candidatus Sericytochromatia bacterium]